MHNQVQNNYAVSPYKSRGIALLVMLGIILIAFTTVAVSRLANSSGEQKKRIKTTQSLAQSHAAIMAYALTALPRPNKLTALPAFFAEAAPGTLPCPDTDGDGVSNPQTGPCTLRRGLVPFITLGISQPLDGSDSPIWYVVPTEYSGNPLILNSSVVPTLTLDGNAVAFILIAPNKPLGGQARVSRFPAAALFAQYLEGENGNASITTYTDIRDNNPLDVMDNTINDQVLAEPVGVYWTAVEGRVLKEVGDRLRAYRLAGCALDYPWAAPVANNNNIGSPTAMFDGRLPLTNWDTTCAPAPAAWVTTHWRTLLYYAICSASANPPSTPCLELDGNGDNNDAEAIVMSPGVAFAFQSRLPLFPPLPSLFEGGNLSTTDNNFEKVKPVNHSGNFNDLIHIVR